LNGREIGSRLIESVIVLVEINQSFDLGHGAVDVRDSLSQPCGLGHALTGGKPELGNHDGLG